MPHKVDTVIFQPADMEKHLDLFKSCSLGKCKSNILSLGLVFFFEISASLSIRCPLSSPISHSICCFAVRCWVGCAQRASMCAEHSSLLDLVLRLGLAKLNPKHRRRGPWNCRVGNNSIWVFHYKQIYFIVSLPRRLCFHLCMFVCMIDKRMIAVTSVGISIKVSCASDHIHCHPYLFLHFNLGFFCFVFMNIYEPNCSGLILHSYFYFLYL